jgi:hypothetical protein
MGKSPNAEAIPPSIGMAAIPHAIPGTHSYPRDCLDSSVYLPTRTIEIEKIRIFFSFFFLLFIFYFLFLFFPVNCDHDDMGVYTISLWAYGCPLGHPYDHRLCG